jgi:CRP/FNR family cyclic AMP-dependent transcriptional regulator
MKAAQKTALAEALYDSELGNFLGREDLDALFQRNETKTFMPGDVILQQGKQYDGFFIIITGTVAVSAKILGEGTLNLFTLGPGNFMGEVSYIDKRPCTTSMIANSQVECLFIAHSYLELLSAYFSETRYKLSCAITAQVCARLKILHDRIITFMTDTNMTKKSFFGELIHSFTLKEKRLALDDSGIDYKKLVATFPFVMFNEKELDVLLEHAALVEVPKNCVLISTNANEKVCYIVLRGAVQSSITCNNKFAKLSIIGPECLFASAVCHKDHELAVTFSTCEHSILLKLTEAYLRDLEEHYPLLWHKVYELICRSVVALKKSTDKLEIRLNTELYNR